MRVAPSMNAQAGEGSMRCALEGAAVRVAPSMNAQELANTVTPDARVAGWGGGDALEGAAVRIFRQTGSVCDRAFPRSNRDAGDWK